MVFISFDPVKTIRRPEMKFVKKLETYIDSALLRFGKAQCQCSFLFCDDAFIQNLNMHYRNKDYPTDVLSFAQDEGEILPSGESCLGDVIISAETAMKQALEYEVTYEEELARLATHGVLHLLGYDHERSKEAEEEMLALQDDLLDSFMMDYAGVKSSRI